MEVNNKIVTYYRYRSVSYGFKIAMVVMLFFLTLSRLMLLLYFPRAEIVSDKVLLLILLTIIVYLWIQEVKDFYKLFHLNKDLQETHEQLKRAEIDTIAALVKAVEEKDLYTRGHSERVTKIASAIAEEMGLDEETKRIVYRSGILHDVGKIGIRDDILNKKEKLTEEEWQIIKSHPEKAFKILEPLRFLEAERDIILSHHERCNGRGYPNGLKEGGIRQEALILAVADSFDAMNSKRAYRDALDKVNILSELVAGKGIQYSTEIVNVFLALLEKKPELWEK